MADRSVERIASPNVQRHGAGLTTYDAGRDVIGNAIEPFIFVSMYDMAGPTFPPHPHAGFSVATYILPESPVGFINHDTLGNRNRIAPGALHVTVAGRGVKHEEQPEKSGSVARGFQIWIDHAREKREMEPVALHLRAEDVPVVETGSSRIRVVLGEAAGVSSPLASPTPVRLIDVTLGPNEIFAEAIGADENVFLFLLAGTLAAGGTDVEAGSIVAFARDGEGISLQDGPDGARFTLFAGHPLNDASIQRGPFVASDEMQLERFATNYHRGAFGTLQPFAAQPDWAPNDGQVIP
jgi:redox-sensitive bicupin YhaK (pirin superfamily)